MRSRTRYHYFRKLIVIGLLFLPLALSAQNIDLSKIISINAKNRPLSEVLEEISEKGGIKFSFSHDQIPTSENITFSATNASLESVFQALFEKLNISYSVVEEQVILRPKKIDNVVSEKEKPERVEKYTISGYVRDDETKESLINATILVRELMVGTITNEYGFYSLTLPKGEYTLMYSYVGFKNISQKVVLNGSQKLSFDLPFDDSMLFEVVVSAVEQEDVLEEHQMSEMKIRPLTLQQIPSFLGEPDAIKSLQTIPGIKSFGDGSTAYFVRGGNKDQNLILVDDAPIFNSSHMLGFFSTIIPDAVKNMEIYKGDIPVSKGGRLSSLIDIKTRDGNMSRFGGNGSLGMLAYKLSIEGPFRKDKSSWFISFRRSNLEWLIKRSSPGLELYFYDFTTKVNFGFNQKNRVFVSFYTGKDVLSQVSTSVGSFGLNWGNFAGSMRWNHVFNDKIFSNITLYSGQYDYNLIISAENNDKWNSYITNAGLKWDFSHYTSPHLTLKYGCSVSTQTFNPGTLSLSSVPPDQIPNVSNSKARETAYYFSADQSLGKKFSVRYGFRLPIWRNQGPTTVYLFDDEYNVSDTLVVNKNATGKRYINIEPRLSIKFKASSLSVVKVGYGRTLQHNHLLSNLVTPFTSLEVWVPSGENIAPQKADQIALSFTRKLFDQQFEGSVEGYYKVMHNQIDYEDHANMLLNPLIEGELRFGEAKSWGIEFLFLKKAGKLEGWIAYTWSRTWKITPDVNLGRAYPAQYDRPHDFSVYLVWHIGKRWDLSCQWVYLTGAPFTSPTGFYDYQGYTIPYYGEKNNDRLPDYHRLDITANLKLSKPERRFQQNLSLTIFNVYNRQNPISVNFNKISEDGEIVVPSDHYAKNENIMTQISLLGIFPSLNYCFKF